MNLGLAEKRVLITGASKGIGAAMANGFLNEGAKVCIVSRGSEQLYETQRHLSSKFGQELVNAEMCDCTKTSSLLNLRDRVQNKWGSLNIVVANVGDGRSTQDPIPKEEIWRETWGKWIGILDV